MGKFAVAAGTHGGAGNLQHTEVGRSVNSSINPSGPSLRKLLTEAVRQQQQGHHDEAERLYRAVLATHPQQPDALHYLGLLAHQNGRTALANGLLEQSLALSPDNPVFHYNAAAVLAGQSRWREAIPLYQRALELKSGDADAWHGLASALQALGHPEDAVACWQRGLAIRPQHIVSWMGLTDTYRSLGLTAEELEACETMQGLAPQDPVIATRMAESLIAAGSYERAARILEDVLSKTPNMASAYCLKGVLLTILGDFTGAGKQFEAALNISPDFSQVYVNFVAIKKFSLTDPLVSYLEENTQNDHWKELSQKINVHFSLGKIYHDNHDYTRAFMHYLPGNTLFRQTIDYSTDSQRKYFSGIKHHLGRDFLVRHESFAEPSNKPVFIVGMPRSGTSLVEQILASHPDIHGGGELTFLSNALRRRLGVNFRVDFAHSVATLENGALRDISQEYMRNIRAIAPNASRVTDKMPSNFMQIGLMNALFPNARIIHCRRDPLDTCVSCFTTLFKSGQSFSYDLKELGEFYGLYEDLMNYWYEVLPPGAIIDVQYENLAHNPENEARRLIDHLGMEWNSECLKFQDTKRPVRTASMYQVRQPMYQSSIGRWRLYGEHLQPLMDALAL